MTYDEAKRITAHTVPQVAAKRLTIKEAKRIESALTAAGYRAETNKMGDGKPTVMILELWEGQWCAIQGFRHPGEFEAWAAEYLTAA